MITKELKVWVINDNATVCGMNKEEVINWFEHNSGVNVESIEESRMDLEFSSKVKDDNTLEEVEVWQSVEDKIVEHIKSHGGIKEPFIVCGFSEEL